MDRDRLDELIGEAPQEPGVYIFRDDDRVVYVGKAVDIRDRLASYRDPRTPRIRAMVERADAIETRTTEDGRQALLLEANLIKRYQPRYNTRLKDGKSYPVIELTDHAFPQIRASRDPDARSLVFGPFTSMGQVETAIRAFRDLYGLRACSDHTLETRDRPCVAYQMGLCSAPCAGLISEEEYADRVEIIRTFFREDPEPVLEELEDRMQQAADEQRFERAATLKEYREALTALIEGQADRETGEAHALAVGPDRSRIGRVVLEDDQLREKTGHRLAGEPGTDRAALAAFIQQFYARTELPDRLVVEQLPEDTALRDWLAAESTELVEPADGRDRVLVDAARSAASTGRDDRLEQLAEALGHPVDRIECFDISHTGGDDVVGADVVFIDGRPETDEYRRKLLTGNDDYQNMALLTKWRAERALAGRDDRPDPDLLLIDGGRGQLEAARRALESLGWDVPVLGIVKPDDAILGPRQEDPELPSGAAQLLAEARDEAHRFAQRSHTDRRDRIDSVLEEIDGVGPETRKRLLQAFSMDEIRSADLDQLQQVEGVGPMTAQRIHDGLGPGPEAHDGTGSKSDPGEAKET